MLVERWKAEVGASGKAESIKSAAPQQKPDASALLYVRTLANQHWRCVHTLTKMRGGKGSVKKYCEGRAPVRLQVTGQIYHRNAAFLARWLSSVCNQTEDWRFEFCCSLFEKKFAEHTDTCMLNTYKKSIMRRWSVLTPAIHASPHENNLFMQFCYIF